MNRANLIVVGLIAVLALIGCREVAAPFPLWDGKESNEHYARRVGLEPSQTLDLGDSVKLDLVLIPSGRFFIGTPSPETMLPSEGPIWGILIFSAALAFFVVLLAVVFVRSRKDHRKPQFSLRFLLLLTLVAACCVWGGVRWRLAKNAQQEYELAWNRSLVHGHEVLLTRPRYMGRFEVTREQYAAIMHCSLPDVAEDRDLPVDDVPWRNAVEFCDRLSRQTGRTIRLPTEAEWEFACRAGTRSDWYCGDCHNINDGPTDIAWYYENSGGKPHPVGRKLPNAFGLYDMHGNVREWCSDWYANYASSPELVTDPQGPASYSGCPHVARGGHYADDALECRAACRQLGNPAGFRVVMEVPKQ